MPTEERPLSLAIALLAMAALGTGAAGVARIDRDDEDTGELRLVCDEAARWRKAQPECLARWRCPTVQRVRIPLRSSTARPLEVSWAFATRLLLILLFSAALRAASTRPCPDAFGGFGSPALEGSCGVLLKAALDLLPTFSPVVDRAVTTATLMMTM